MTTINVQEVCALLEKMELNNLLFLCNAVHVEWDSNPTNDEVRKLVHKGWSSCGIANAGFFERLSVLNRRRVCLFYNLPSGCDNCSVKHRELNDKHQIHRCLFCNDVGHTFGFQDFKEHLIYSQSNRCTLYRQVAVEFHKLLAAFQLQWDDWNDWNTLELYQVVTGDACTLFVKPKANKVAEETPTLTWVEIVKK